VKVEALEEAVHVDSHVDNVEEHHGGGNGDETLVEGFALGRIKRMKMVVT